MISRSTTCSLPFEVAQSPQRLLPPPPTTVKVFHHHCQYRWSLLISHRSQPSFHPSRNQPLLAAAWPRFHMGFCHVSADNVAFVTATYLIALLPWSVLSLWDPINRNWEPFWLVFGKSWIYLIVSILPYFLLIPYAILQGCSEDGDIKELLTAVITMFASLWNLRRAVRGLFALQEVRRIWEKVDVRELALCFADWLPEHELESEYDLCKRDVVDILVSHSLVDNDWPGEAPQTAYIWDRYPTSENENSKEFYFPSVRAVDSEILQKRCILILWCVWMVHAWHLFYSRTRYLMEVRPNSFLRKCVKYILGSNENDPNALSTSSSEDSRTASMQHNWIQKCLNCISGNRRQLSAIPMTASEDPQEVSPQGGWLRICLQRIIRRQQQHDATPETASEDSETLQTKWECPVCVNQPLGLRERSICTWCVLRPLVTRAYGVCTDYGFSTVLEFELLNQVSNLPSEVQGSLKMSDGARILDLYAYHSRLDVDNLDLARRENQRGVDPRCPASRMGFVLGLSNLYDDSVDQWLRSSAETSDGSLSDRRNISRDDMNKKFLSFALLLAAQGKSSDLTQTCSTQMLVRRVSRIIRTITFLLRSDSNIEPLDILQGRRNQQRWNALLSSVLGEDWGESPRRSSWNTAVRNELGLLTRILTRKTIPNDSHEQLRLVPSCIAYTFEDIKRNPLSFYNNNHIVVPARDSILSNRNCWVTRDDDMGIVWRGSKVNRSERVIDLEAKFEVDNNTTVLQLWKAGLAFCFPSWTKKSWPSAHYDDIEFEVSVYDNQRSSFAFRTEALKVFHFAHFTNSRPWSEGRQQIFPLETLHLLFDDQFGRFFTHAPPHPVDHSYWLVLECWGIPTSNSGSSVISLSLKSRYSGSPFENDIEIHSFWIAKQAEPSNLEQKHRTLSAVQRCK